MTILDKLRKANEAGMITRQEMLSLQRNKLRLEPLTLREPMAFERVEQQMTEVQARFWHMLFTRTAERRAEWYDALELDEAAQVDALIEELGKAVYGWAVSSSVPIGILRMPE